VTSEETIVTVGGTRLRFGRLRVSLLASRDSRMIFALVRLGGRELCLHLHWSVT